MDDIVDTEGSGVSSPSAVTTDMVTTINTATATRDGGVSDAEVLAVHNGRKYPPVITFEARV